VLTRVTIAVLHGEHLQRSVNDVCYVIDVNTILIFLHVPKP